MFILASDFHLQKTPGSVITSGGNVAFVSDDCTLVLLANPDAATRPDFWSTALYSDSSAVSSSLHSDCADLVLDESDHAFTVACDYNSLACSVYGWDLSSPTNAAPLSWSPMPLVKGAFPRILELYTAGLLYTGGKIFMPLSYTLSLGAGGVAIIDTATGASSTQKVGGNGVNVGATGMAGLPGGGVAAMLSYDNGRTPGISMAFLDGTTGAVTGNSISITRQDIDQPHPLVDPFSGNVYAMTFQNLPPSPVLQLLCVNPTSGLPCAGYPANGSSFLDDFDNFTAQWYYGAAALPNANKNALAGLVFTIDTSIGPDPISGCLVIISPSTRAVTQSVCYSRASIVAVQHFAAAPIVAVDARGPGLHTILVVEFDFTVSAFDPANLAAGPLYRTNPLAAGTSGTVSCDYMLLTPGGSLVLNGWRDDLKEYTVIAIPNVLRPPSSGGGGGSGKSSGGLSPEAAAGVAVAVIVVVLAAAVGGLYYTGRLPGVLKAVGLGRLACGSGGGYSSMGGSSSSSKSASFGGKALPAYGGYSY